MTSGCSKLCEEVWLTDPLTEAARGDSGLHATLYRQLVAIDVEMTKERLRMSLWEP